MSLLDKFIDKFIIKKEKNEWPFVRENDGKILKVKIDGVNIQGRYKHHDNYNKPKFILLEKIKMIGDKNIKGIMINISNIESSEVIKE